MSVLSDEEIQELCEGTDSPMIQPYVSYPVRYVSKCKEEPLPESFQMEPNEELDFKRVISFGQSSYGYDVRLAGDLKQIKIIGKSIAVDPKNVEKACLLDPELYYRVCPISGPYIDIPPGGCLLGPTTETFNIPRDVIVIVTGKSTYARAGLIVNVTPIEPEFQGEVIIEIINPTRTFIRCYLNEGIAQFVFLGHNSTCRLSYKDKGGKYQGQTGLRLGEV